MSVYSNQFGINMSEAATLIFNHVMNDGTPDRIVQTVAMVTVPNEALRDMYKAIGDTIKSYDEQLKNKSIRKDMN